MSDKNKNHFNKHKGKYASLGVFTAASIPSTIELVNMIKANTKNFVDKAIVINLMNQLESYLRNEKDAMAKTIFIAILSTLRTQLQTKRYDISVVSKMYNEIYRIDPYLIYK